MQENPNLSVLSNLLSLLSVTEKIMKFIVWRHYVKSILDEQQFRIFVGRILGEEFIQNCDVFRLVEIAESHEICVVTLNLHVQSLGRGI